MTRRLADAQGYRRGMVLGLTMAEIMLLLVFLLLLAASALLFRRDGADALAQAQRDRQAASAGELADLRARAAAQEARLGTLEAGLAQSHAEVVRAEEGRALADAALARQSANVRAQAAQLAAAQAEAHAVSGQNAQMRAELSRLHGNAGSGLPYCWTTPDGRPVTALRVQLRDGGVIAQEPSPRPRPEDPAWATLAGLQRNVLLPVESFMAQTAGLVAQSDADRCRFAIDVIDGTSATNKPGYKGLMNRLWGSFLLHEISG